MAITPDEILARFIFHARYIKNDQSVRADIFIPYPWPDLSVTRHLKLKEARLWKIGQYIAKKRKLMLHGRADLSATVFISQKLYVVPDPVLHNCNHATVKGWPIEKADQKIIALELADAVGKAVLSP